MLPQIHIYSNSHLDGRSRSDLEDDIRDYFQDEIDVTGGGQGKTAWDIDLELTDEGADVPRFASELVTFLLQWGGAAGHVLERVPP